MFTNDTMRSKRASAPARPLGPAEGHGHATFAWLFDQPPWHRALPLTSTRSANAAMASLGGSLGVFLATPMTLWLTCRNSPAVNTLLSLTPLMGSLYLHKDTREGV